MRILIKLVSFVLAAVLAILAGCEKQSDVSSVGQVKKPIDRSSPGKTSAPITIQHSLEGVTAVGQTIRVNLKIVPRVSVVSLTIGLAADPTLQIVSSDSQETYNNVAANSAITKTVEVSPQSEGLFYLNVFVQISGNGNPSSRAYSIPIPVGDKASAPAMKPSGTLDTGDGDERTIDVPAEITIKRK